MFMSIVIIFAPNTLPQKIVNKTKITVIIAKRFNQTPHIPIETILVSLKI